jgi:hypothetical protein
MASQHLHSSSGLPRDPKLQNGLLGGLTDSALQRCIQQVAKYIKIQIQAKGATWRDIPSTGGLLKNATCHFIDCWDTGLRVADTVIVMNPIHPPDRARALASSTSGTLEHPKAAESPVKVNLVSPSTPS